MLKENNNVFFRYLQVDIYGNITKYKASCGNDSVTVNKCPGKTNEECLKVINNTYLVCMMNM